MYRIELAPGEVTVFRTIEELATGVRNGVISSKARIYHGASEKWLPIEFHPHYKKALDLLSGRSGEHPIPKPVDRHRAEGHNLTFLGAPLAPVTPASIPHAPSTHVPTTHVPTTHAPTTEAPTTEAPAAQAPTADEPTAHPPTAHAPTADEPATHTPTSDGPTTHAPRTHAPRTHAPWTHAPRTHAPRTHAPRTHAPIEHTPVAREPLEHDRVTPVEHTPVADAEIEHTPITLAPFEHTPVTHAPEFHAPAAAPRPFFLDEPAAVRPPAPSPLDIFAPKPVELPPVSVSPVVELPRIAYPEITLKEEPVAERRWRGPRRPRPARLIGAVVLLALGGYASTTVLSFGRGDAPFVAASTMADRPAAPAAARPETSGPALAPAPAPATPPVVSKPVASKPAASKPAASKPAALPTASAPSAPLPPASSGFAPALEPRAIVSGPAKSPAKPSGAGADSTTLAPPPIDIDMAVPALPGAVVNATRPKSDSAMKKILRAVSGGKDVPQR